MLNDMPSLHPYYWHTFTLGDSSTTEQNKINKGRERDLNVLRSWWSSGSSLSTGWCLRWSSAPWLIETVLAGELISSWCGGCGWSRLGQLSSLHTDRRRREEAASAQHLTLFLFSYCLVTPVCVYCVHLLYDEASRTGLLKVGAVAP